MKVRDFIFLAFLFHRTSPVDSAKYQKDGEEMAKAVLAHPLCYLFCILDIFLAGYAFKKEYSTVAWVILALIPIIVSVSVDRIYAKRRIDYILYPLGFECFWVSFFCLCYSHKTIALILLVAGVAFSFVIPFRIHNYLLKQEIEQKNNEVTSSPVSASSEVLEQEVHTKTEVPQDLVPWDY